MPQCKPGWSGRSLAEHPHIVVATVVAVGIVLACTLAWGAFVQARENAGNAFRIAAREHATAISRSWRQQIGSVGKVADLFRASRVVTRAEFGWVTRSLLARHPAIQALEWAPRITDVGRPIFIARARGEFPGYTIRDINDEGMFVPAGQRPVYFPIRYVEPLEGNRQALGYAPADHPERNHAIRRAIVRGALTVSAVTRPVQSAGKRAALLAFVPVKRSDGTPHSMALHGLAEGVFFVEDLVDEALSTLRSDGLALSIVDRTAQTGTPLYGARPAVETPHWYQWPNTQRYTDTWEIGGRTFATSVTPAGARFAYDLRGPAIVALLALCVIALAAWLVALLLRRERSVRQLAEERGDELLYLSRHDPLTGLLNRTGFQQCLETALERIRTGEPRVASLCFLDLDQFKLINDVCGHEAGDELLQRLAERLASRIRPGDIIARLGGDEFGLLLYGRCGDDAAEEAATYLHDVEMTRFTWGERVFPVTASIGIVEINAHSESVAALMSQTDAACYIAKEHGRNCLHVFREGDQLSDTYHQQMLWVSGMREALEEDRLTLFYQRIRPCRAARTEHDPDGVEILVRLRERDGTLIPPGTFLPAAERYGLMPSVDRWVVSHLLGALSKHGRSDGLWFINLSGQTLGDLTFCDFIMHCLHHHGVKPQSLCFEITESAVITNLASARVFIERLRAVGCRFALDDFGSGMSSFTYLKELPVDFLKIEGSFVRGMPGNRMDLAVTGAIQRLANELGLQTIAEFVEDETVLAAARSLGVDYAQGYLFGRPAPLAELLQPTPRPQLTLIHGNRG